MLYLLVVLIYFIVLKTTVPYEEEDVIYAEQYSNFNIIRGLAYGI